MPDRALFVSYAHADDPKYYTELERHLRTTLRSLPEIEVWTDQRIQMGGDWKREIDAALNRCDCAILMISSHFLDSRFIYHDELPVILTKALDDPSFALFPLFVSKVTKRALTIELSYRGRTKKFDLSTRQGPNGPDDPLQPMTDPERNQVLVKLVDQLAARMEQPADPGRGKQPVQRRRPSAPPPVRSSERAHELLLQIERTKKGLARRFFFTGHPEPRDFSIKDTSGEAQLRYWKPCQAFHGDHLYSLLFGDDTAQRDEILGGAFGLDRNEKVAAGRHPLRVRLMTDDPNLLMLPWATISERGRPLRELGWSVELTPRNGSVPPPCHE